ncbi:hypothetical protein AQUCO_11500013v1 [Aquilegia coerulea]|uniref:Knottin scorpion toxin-like domain-containing protein n=1 Tax=Aquilegia coerulea TaxID=218851 RepID=A0A2G5C2A7_AQUCA|nr:hypothetical protein AQUCO_11500013v1 [Aquilegia coerulea]
MAAATHVPMRTNITTTLLLTVMVLVCSIPSGQGSIIECYNKCSGNMFMCWPKCAITGVLIGGCLTKCFSDAQDCFFACD